MSLPVVAGRLARAALQVALAAVSSLGAWWLADGRFPDTTALGWWLRCGVLVLPIRAVVYWPFGLYGGLWRYASVRELFAIVAAVLVGTFALGLMSVVVGVFPHLPPGFFAADTLLLVFLLGAVRLVPRLPRERASAVSRTRVLVFGAGDAGAMILRDMRNADSNTSRLV